jgi:predicted TIM-barrel fold metal-dependent hydrolase
MQTSAVPVIDCDSHVVEPPDLWTSRLATKYQDDAPHVEPDPVTGELRWHIADRDVSGVGLHGHGGWKEYWPSYPPTFEELDPATHDAAARLKKLDEHGIDRQLIFPNLLGFNVYAFMALKDPELSIACVRAYNDYQTEFCSIDRHRFIPQMYLPFWDIPASIVELERCIDLGHKSVVFSAAMEKVGLPRLRDPHWDPILSRVQEANLPLTFHIGFTNVTEADIVESHGLTDQRDFVMNTALFMLGNARDISEVIMSGLCERYPQLKFVSIESGFGYLPYLMESLDWQFLNLGGRAQFRDFLLPSEYFRRQVYASFWFEADIDRVIDLYPDNAMFSSDYPHPTSLSPGPGSHARNARETIEANLSKVPDDIRRKLLNDNAVKVYNLA